MSKTAEKEERVEETPQQFIDKKLTEMADRMRQYDKLLRQAKAVERVAEAAADPLSDLDIETPFREMPSEVAYKALGLLILQRKAADVKRQIEEVKFNVLEPELASSVLFGSMLRITARGDRSLETKNLTGTDLGKYYDMREGAFRKMSFDVADGGAIEIRSRRTFSDRVFGAQPLIDRRNGYQPAFDIQVID